MSKRPPSSEDEPNKRAKKCDDVPFEVIQQMVDCLLYTSPSPRDS